MHLAKSAKNAKTEKMDMNENQIAAVIVNCAFRLHQVVGPGLLESAYEAMLAHDLRKQGLDVLTQQPIPVVYDGLQLEVGFRADLLVGGLVIVELKSIESLQAVYKKQLLTYLKLSGKKLGLLINFGAPSFKGNVIRIANGLEDHENSESSFPSLRS